MASVSGLPHLYSLVLCRDTETGDTHLPKSQLVRVELVDKKAQLICKTLDKAQKKSRIQSLLSDKFSRLFFPAVV